MTATATTSMPTATAEKRSHRGNSENPMPYPTAITARYNQPEGAGPVTALAIARREGTEAAATSSAERVPATIRL